MRAAGQDVLPFHQEETQPGWNERLTQNILFNQYELTLNQLAGKPFSEPIALGDDIPEALAEHFEDIDLQGNTLDAFCYQWFRDALRASVGCVLVDFPRVAREDEEGNPIERTLADDRAENLRPYWTHVPLENIIFASTERIGGVETLIHLRLMEEITEQVGFSEQTIEQIRVLEPGLVTLYRKQDPKKQNSPWVEYNAYTTDLPYIPLITFYTDREAPFQGKPLLDDLAHMNIRHWQSMSDQIRALTVSRFAMLVGKGMYENETSDVVVGPEQAMWVPADGDLYWLEAKGTALDQGWKELEGLEERMGAYGAQLLKKQPGNQTATARALDSAEAMSPIQAAALAFQSAVEEALAVHADWMRLDGSGSVKINTDFHSLDESNQSVLKTLDTAADMDRISRRAWVAEMKRRNVLVEDYDLDEDKLEIEAAIEERMARMPQIDLDPEGGEPGDEPEEEDE